MKINSYMPVRIFSGSGALTDAADAIAALGKKCLIVTGGSSAKKSGALDDCAALLRSLSIGYEVFDGIGQNPLTTDCYNAGHAALRFGADFLIGIGGGSPLDAVKAAALYASNPEVDADGIYPALATAKRPLPYVLIGTTAGTGSEVTGVSVLTHSVTGRKKSISGPLCYGEIAVCDPKYTRSAPRGVTVSCALDAFAHAAESFFSVKANSISRLYAEKALKLIWPELKKLDASLELPDDEGRENLYFGSLYAGLAINVTGTLFPHTVGYALTEDHGVPHGRACTAFFPALYEKCEKICPEKATELLAILGADRTELISVIGRLTDVRIGIPADEAEKYRERFSAKIKNFDNTPGGFTVDEALEALTRLNKGTTASLCVS